MELYVGSGNAIKTIARCITCLARIGNEIVIVANPSEFKTFQSIEDMDINVFCSLELVKPKLAQGSTFFKDALIYWWFVLITLNSSRSAYLSITFKSDFFEKYTIFGTQAQCSVLLKALCAILRTSPASIDRLSMRLPDSEATKLQCTVDCINGLRKTYWINCNAQPDIQHLNLDKKKFPSHFIVKAREFNRLLANFQASLQEITVIATEILPVSSDTPDGIGGKAVELRSYIDPTKENADASLHTQLWIDPAEEFLQYIHRGDPVDVTFSMKELKAFISFCEACEVDIQFFFDKAGKPILLAPRFGMEDVSSSDFNATLVLATMLLSQLPEGNTMGNVPAAPVAPGDQDHQNSCENLPRHSSVEERPRRVVVSPNNSQHPSDHTRIWSELSGSAAQSVGGSEERTAHLVGRPAVRQQDAVGCQRCEEVDYSMPPPTGENPPILRSNAVVHHPVEPQDRMVTNDSHLSQRHPNNWIDSVDDEDNDECEMYVQSTP